MTSRKFSVLAALLCACVCFADDYREAALRRATESVEAAAERARQDPSRPAFHFLSPAQWMNDPNGPIVHNGYYHIFYQHNPYGDTWGHMHWGHARSKDLVHWQNLPIALWPSEDKGEAHVFSGCAAINGNGVPMLFYTSVSTADTKRPNEQWAAIGDTNLIEWEKHPKNPLLTTSMVPFAIGPDWRDPFVFHAGGRTFLVCGADTTDEAIIPIFEASSPQLDAWTYKGILYRKPKSEVPFFECPNFFPLQDKFVLIYSPYKPLRYAIGSFDAGTLAFTPEKEGTLDYGSFYASNIFQREMPQEPVLVGWIRGFKDGLGWNGCMSLPRDLSIGSDGFLRQMPAKSLDALKASESPKIQGMDLHRTVATIGSTSRIEIAVHLSVAGSVVVTMKPHTEGVAPIQYTIQTDGVVVGEIRTNWPTPENRTSVSSVCYVDNSVLELTCCAYTSDADKSSGTINVSKVIEYSPGGYEIHVEARNGAVIAHAAIGNMNSIWK